MHSRGVHVFTRCPRPSLFSDLRDSRESALSKVTAAVVSIVAAAGILKENGRGTDDDYIFYEARRVS